MNEEALAHWGWGGCRSKNKQFVACPEWSQSVRVGSSGASCTPAFILRANLVAAQTCSSTDHLRAT